MFNPFKLFKRKKKNIEIPISEETISEIDVTITPKSSDFFDDYDYYHKFWDNQEERQRAFRRREEELEEEEKIERIKKLEEESEQMMIFYDLDLYETQLYIDGLNDVENHYY